ncbi:17758_t:CDS:2, partial [Racocetra fulgida]
METQWKLDGLEPSISDDEDKQSQHHKSKKFSKKALKTVTDIQQEKLNKSKEKIKEEDKKLDEKLDDGKSIKKNGELKANSEKVNALNEESDESKSNSEDASSPLQKIKSVDHASNSPVQLSISERLARLHVKDDSTQGLPGDSNSIQYTKFEFDDKNKKKKKLDNMQLMNKLKSKAEKFEKLKKEDPEKAAKFRENEAWSKALQMARGEKIKDDPKLLKKTIKKINFKKKTVTKTQAERQQKRTENIQARIDAKKNK